MDLPATPTNTIPEQVQAVVGGRLSEARVTLISSEPGRGRNVALQEALGERCQGKYVFVDALTLHSDDELVALADDLEHADVVCIDALSRARANVRPALLELTLNGRSPMLPVQFQPPRRIELREGVLVVLSEQTDFADAIEMLVTSASEEVDLQRFDLVL